MGRRKNLLSKEYYVKYWNIELTNIVTNIFKWEGLPEEINKCAMEKDIMLGGYSIFFKDKMLDTYFSLPGALSGVNVYGYPTMAKPIGKNAEITFPEYTVDKECVLIYANKTRTTTLYHIQEYADKLADIDLAIKMNTLAVKHPVMIKTTEQTKESFNTLMHQYEDNYYIIVADKTMALDGGVEILNLNVSADEIATLQKQKETLKNEFYNLFGISGSVEKRERIISGEVNAMMQQIGVNREIWLSERQRAVKKINDIFGLNIKVGFNEVDFTENENEDKKEVKNEQANK